MFLRLIPRLFYEDVATGVDLFVDGLGFTIVHRDETLVVVARDGAKAHLVQDATFAAKDRPAISIETDAIDAAWADVSARRPDLLHPDGRVVTLRPWGARESAVRDATSVCVVLREWPAPVA